MQSVIGSCNYIAVSNACDREFGISIRILHYRQCNLPHHTITRSQLALLTHSFRPKLSSNPSSRRFYTTDSILADVIRLKLEDTFLGWAQSLAVRIQSQRCSRAPSPSGPSRAQECSPQQRERDSRSPRTPSTTPSRTQGQKNEQSGVR